MAAHSEIRCPTRRRPSPTTSRSHAAAETTPAATNTEHKRIGEHNLAKRCKIVNIRSGTGSQYIQCVRHIAVFEPIDIKGKSLNEQTFLR